MQLDLNTNTTKGAIKTLNKFLSTPFWVKSLSLHTREYMPGRQDRDDTISAFAFAFSFAFVHILGVIRADQECSGDTLWVELG